jgi:hypothetical protein
MSELLALSMDEALALGLITAVYLLVIVPMLRAFWRDVVR